MIFAIGVPGGSVRMFLETESRERVQQQLAADEVAFDVPDRTRGMILEDGAGGYRVAGLPEY